MGNSKVALVFVFEAESPQMAAFTSRVMVQAETVISSTLEEFGVSGTQSSAVIHSDEFFDAVKQLITNQATKLNVKSGEGYAALVNPEGTVVEERRSFDGETPKQLVERSFPMVEEKVKA